MLINPFFFVTETSFIIVGIGSEADGGIAIFNNGYNDYLENELFSGLNNDYVQVLLFGGL